MLKGTDSAHMFRISHLFLGVELKVTVAAWLPFFNLIITTRIKEQTRKKVNKQDSSVLTLILV